MAATTYHLPVLASACTELLAQTPAGWLVDATVGGGGHAERLRERCASTHQLIGVDKDPDALAATRARLGADAITLLRGDFRDLKRLLAEQLGEGRRVSGILADLGVSSWQLDAPGRGFAFKHPEAPLDMRMDPTDDDTPTARELIASLDESALARVLRDYGEVQGAHGLARRLKEARDRGGLKTTGDLARLVEEVTRPARREAHRRIHPATKAFQALRIAVNDELGALDRLLDEAADLLLPGGRLVIISYHSLEDRRVKQTLRLGERGPSRPGHLPPPSGWRPTWRVLTRKPIVASADERRANPRARSAKLRAAERAPLTATAGGPA